MARKLDPTLLRRIVVWAVVFGAVFAIAVIAFEAATDIDLKPGIGGAIGGLLFAAIFVFLERRRCKENETE